MKLVKILASSAAIILLTVSCSAQKNTVIDGVVPPTQEQVDSASYLIGVNFGAMIKQNRFAESLDDLNLAEIKKGMEDFMNAKGTPNPYDPEFAKQFKIDLSQMQRIMDAYISSNIAYKRAKMKKAEDEILAKNALKENVDTLPSGLQYTIIEEGAPYKPQPVDTVLVNYKGKLWNGEVFDQNDSVSFPLNGVIKGWTEGMGLVGEGGKITLYIPFDLAYGEYERPGIPAYSTLVFDVEVIKVSPKVEKPKDNKKE